VDNRERFADKPLGSVVVVVVVVIEVIVAFWIFSHPKLDRFSDYDNDNDNDNDNDGVCV
jgi:uncharacterized protein YxeA